MKRAKALMVLGTSSGVGKSFLTAGLCRLFSDWGYKVAPFKAQNMSNNSYVTQDGGEIGRAQAVQAEAARILPTVDMNPILLKPSADDGSQVVVQGKALGHFKARDYFAKREEIRQAIQESYERLASQYDILILEGAGSPAEVNLKKNDLVNMAAAEMADAKCLLVADIDRGGVFASLIGTLDLLELDERERVCGLVINKFRGDQSLFEDGVKFLTQRTGKPVLGVLPFDRSLWIEEEDSVSLESYALKTSPLGAGETAPLEIAVILLPRMSNFTDFEVLKHEPGVHLRYVRKPGEIGNCDLLILPGTKSTLADFLYIVEGGFREAILDYIQSGGALLGICGGYQMMGSWIVDRDGVESSEKKIKGLDLFKMLTEFQPEKILRRISETIETEIFGQKVLGAVEAYEIHMGVTHHEESYASFGKAGILHPNGRVLGTYYHGLFDHGQFRRSFLEALAARSGKTLVSPNHFSLQEIKEIHYNKLSKMLQERLDVTFLRQALALEKMPG